MNHILVILIYSILILSGCGSSNKIDNQVVEESKNDMKSTYKIGEVYLGRKECEIYILTEGKNQEKLYPVGLDKSFRINGAVLQFEYDLSRAHLPKGCEDSRTVVLRNITRLKR